ncbi:MAG: hypothetical protein U0U69_12160 [Acidimicrobiia bacterium]
MRRAMPAAVAAALTGVLALTGACSSGAETSTSTTAASPTSAPDVVTTDGGYVIGGYRVTSVEPDTTGITLPSGLQGVTGYRYAQGSDEVALGIQGFLPETESPNDASLKRVLGEVAPGATATEIGIGEQRGFEAEAGGQVFVANLLEDGTVNVVRGTDKAALVAMLVALNTATSVAQ